MNSASSMYKELILDLYKNPVNFGKLDNATHTHCELNPLCGDRIHIQLILEEDKVNAVKFLGSGCAISMAASSLLTEEIKGKSKSEMMSMGKDSVLDLLGIPIGPVRLKCALLCLETLHKAIQGDS